MKSPLLVLLLLFIRVAAKELEPPRWCLPKPGVSPEKLQSVLNYVCSHMACPQSSDRCFASYDLPGRVGVVMNLYFQTYGRTEEACFFGGDGMIVTTNPGYGECVYYTASAATIIPPTMLLLLLLFNLV
ncbi:unnamed protein product [Eruca vesicaria subsp. sativa]|uniref:X8 domain-containing protein n=1 Tax=Eruca vesicaria subsp. sativa TaxID=29727 RepID=A0ABC8J8T2_ERUVS|nr:unnamed protein product [Eruca vesicaria subsp. sativa]